MLRYIISRLLLVIPALFAVSLFLFTLSKCKGEDPVHKAYGDGSGNATDPETYALDYAQKAEKIGKYGPDFYFSLTTAAFPDTLHQIYPISRRERLTYICAQTGNWPAVQSYEKARVDLIRAIKNISDTASAKGAIIIAADAFAQKTPLEEWPEALSRLQQTAQKEINIAPALSQFLAAAQTVQSQTSKEKLSQPAFYWYGLDNQYQRWWTGFLTGNLGEDYIIREKVWRIIRSPLLYTLVLNLTVFLTAYLLAVPLGLRMARRKDQIYDRAWRAALILILAIPTFAFGSLVIGCISGLSMNDYATSTQSFGPWLLQNLPPFLCLVGTLSLHTLAVLALQMRSGILETIGQDFIRTARAKGVDERGVFWYHAYRNALSPLITMLAGAFPALLAGSMISESLFRYPGMGTLIQTAFENDNYPIIFASLMLAAVMTILGSMVGDILRAKTDPRVRLGER
jgi:peptide/nickel transport system permease protein